MLRKIILQLMFVMAVVVFASALLVFSTTMVGAQPMGGPGGFGGDGPRPPRPMRTEELVKSLRLTTQQTAVVQNTIDAERTAMHALDESLKPQRDTIHTATRSKLAAVLTPDQLQRYDEWRAAGRPPRHESASDRQWDAPTSNRRPSPSTE